MSSFNCAECGKLHHRPAWRIKTFCDETCSSLNRRKERIREWLEDGKDWVSNIPDWVRHYLSNRDGYKCKICFTDTWQGVLLVLEVDHIDGNSRNNNPENLRLICPNCHSQTPTYKNKNKGNGRSYRTSKK